MNSEFQLDVTTQFLSPHVTYTINLLVYIRQYRHLNSRPPFKYKLDKETKYSTSCVALRRDADYLVIKLYRFTSDQEQHHFKIQFTNQSYHEDYSLQLYGIEFQPMEYEKDKDLESENKNVDMQHPVTDFDIEWEQKLTNDYIEIIKWAKYSVQWSTKKELYYILRNGLLINIDGEKWFSISKDMKKRYMQPWGTMLHKEPWRSLTSAKWRYKPSPGSRFDMVAECSNINSFSFVCEVESHLLSDKTMYACYLVYKLPQEHKAFEDTVRMDCKYPSVGKRYSKHYIYFITPPEIPIIRLNVELESDHIPLRTQKIKGHPKLRKDGWMEIQIWELNIRPMNTNKPIKFGGSLSTCNKNDFRGLLVQGIEFRPVKVQFSVYID